MTTQYHAQSEDKIITYEEERKERKAKLIFLIIIGILTATYGSWNFYRMYVAVHNPVVTMKTSIRQSIPVPGVVICGKTLNMQPRCYKSEFNAADDDYQLGASCDRYLTNYDSRMDATQFINMRGFNNLTLFNCFILNPYQKDDGLVFDNSTQKIALALWSTEKANNTQFNITKDEWFFYGTFTERDNPYRVRFQIVKMPSISYIYFKREEHYNISRSGAIFGDATSSDVKSNAKVAIETTFASFDLTGFAISPNLWEILRIVPSKYVTNPGTNTQEYPVSVVYNRVEFTLLQLAANMGGFVSILSAAYFILFGSQRVNPWGIVQRHILKSVPTVPPVYMPSINDNLEKGYRRLYCTRWLTYKYIQRIRHELRAEVQLTIARELEKLKLFLSKYYLKDVIKPNKQ
ncbi:unnamed protein product [Rhizophagus irregularis]|nr:unnamed protein product [Rhizophagus irregularis]